MTRERVEVVERAELVAQGGGGAELLDLGGVDLGGGVAELVELVSLGELGELDRLQGSRTRRGRRSSRTSGGDAFAARTPRARPRQGVSRAREPGTVAARPSRPFELDALQVGDLGVELLQGSRTRRAPGEVRRPTARAFVQPGRPGRRRAVSWSSRPRRRRTDLPPVIDAIERPRAWRVAADRAVPGSARGGRSADNRGARRPWL